MPFRGRCDLGICNGIGTASERILVILVLAILTLPTQARQTEQARTQFECATTKVIMTNKAGQTGSVQVEEHMTFWIDDAAKTFIFSDGRRLRISRFDKSWISASSDDIQYEFNRADRTLTYAGSTTKDNVTTTIVGSGLCEDASTEKSLSDSDTQARLRVRIGKQRTRHQGAAGVPRASQHTAHGALYRAVADALQLSGGSEQHARLDSFRLSVVSAIPPNQRPDATGLV